MTAPLDAAVVRRQVDAVEDPEIPVTLTDLGVVRGLDVDGSVVRVRLRPTRLGCPARGEMERRVRAAVLAAAPQAEVEVSWEMAGWDPDDVTATGTGVLMQIGYADPRATAAACPFCGSEDVRRESEFGGSVCKVPFSCRACGSTFDALKNTPVATSVVGRR